MEALLKYWSIILVALASLIWFVKLEARVQQHDEEIECVRADKKEEIREIYRKLDAMTEEINRLGKAIAELMGYIKGKECGDERSN